MSSIKERDPQITKLNLVLTFNVGPKANPNASTHTNYLITLLKNEYKNLAMTPKTVRVSTNRV